MIEPLNDNIKVKINDEDEYYFGGKDNDRKSSGIVISVPDVMHYFGMHSFVFEESFMNEEDLKTLNNYFKDFVGKRVFWSSGKQLGSVIAEKDGDYAYLKMTDLIAVGDKDDEADNITNSSTGSFKI